MNIPKSILEQGEKPQWSGNVEGNNIEIYYDDEVSQVNPVNMYALFSDKGFHGWLELEFTMSEIVSLSKRETSKYK